MLCTEAYHHCLATLAIFGYEKQTIVNDSGEGSVDEKVTTAVSRKVVAKKRTRQSRKVIWDMIDTSIKLRSALN